MYGKKLYAIIDEAIDNGEVLVKRMNKPIKIDKYDKIKKLKELLDIEAITKEEFDSEKNKILKS